MELDKTMEMRFSNIFLQCFQNIFILWKRSNLSIACAASHPVFSSDAAHANLSSAVLTKCLDRSVANLSDRFSS